MQRSSVRTQLRMGAQDTHRVLALDGGGARGMISLAFLEAIEAQLRQRHGRNDYVLADYYDLIGGTSVGALIATMLALGWPMQRVRATFETWAPRIFHRPFGRGLLWRPRFSETELVACLEAELGDLEIQSPRLVTGLAIICKRIDTGSPWVITNNPNAIYWNDGPYDPQTQQPEWIGNAKYRVADLVRASAAAPTYFHPKTFPIVAAGAVEREGDVGTFVDGGVSPYNSPSLLLFMMCGVNGYGYRWKLGADKLLITSVGTGSYRVRIKPSWFRRMFPIALATEALLGVVSDSQTLGLKLLQWLSQPRNCWTINSEVEDLRDEGLFSLMGSDKPLLSFTRYDVKLEAKWLRAKLGIDTTASSLAKLQALDDISQMEAWRDIGTRSATYQVGADDFPLHFNKYKPV